MRYRDKVSFLKDLSVRFKEDKIAAYSAKMERDTFTNNPKS